MLHWRLILGFCLVGLVALLAWLDFHASRPGLYLAPLALVAAGFGAGEMVRLFAHVETPHAAGAKATSRRPTAVPSRVIVIAGVLSAVLASSAAVFTWPDTNPLGLGHTGWLALGLVTGLMLTFLEEMARYDASGVITIRMARASFAILYVGGLMGFVVQLRLLSGPAWGDDGRWGMVALLSTIAVVKMTDTGAYTAGRLFGRHKMTPRLSPGKTWEGAVGGLLGGVGAAAACLGPLARLCGCETTATPVAWWIGCVAFGLIVGAAGILGDLAESLMKRDAGVKDSSNWMPGFGGVLDLLDSILFAAPVAYALWVLGVVGP